MKKNFPKVFRTRRPRVDAVLAFIVLLVAGLLMQQFGGDARLLNALLGEPIAVSQQAAPRAVGQGGGEAAADEPALNGEIAHEALLPQLPLADMPDSGEPVRFLMHNVQNYFVRGEEQRGRYVVKPKSEESREAVAEVIASAKPAVVGLVEVGGPKALADLRARLAKRGLDYPYYRVLIRPGEDRALAVLSAYPIVHDDSVAQCRLYGKKNRRMLRGILDVTVQLPDKRLFRVVGAHLKSRVSDDPGAAAAQRNEESYTLARHIHEAMKATPKLPMVVYGDWNDGPTDESAKALTQGISADTALQCLTPADSRGDQWTIYYAAGGEYNTFDRLYINKAQGKRLGRRREGGIVDIPAARTASDHRAVWCELK